jgi:hypothetical protein
MSSSINMFTKFIGKPVAGMYCISLQPPREGVVSVDGNWGLKNMKMVKGNEQMCKKNLKQDERKREK